MHLSAELFKRMTGVDMVHVAYRGSAPALNDLVGQNVDLMFDNITSIIGQARAGAVKPLGITLPQRSTLAPEFVPIAEAVPGYETTSWTGVAVRAGTPKVICDMIEADTKTICADAVLKERRARYQFTLGNSAIERLQAARHSGFVMCVAASQNPMQSASDLPPPPGLLGADSLGLEEEVAGDRARLGAAPPPVANWVGNGSDMGESAGSAGSGVTGAAGAVAAGRGTGAAVGAAIVAPGVLTAPVLLLPVADACGPATSMPAAMPGVAAPGLRREEAMPDACPAPPEERASAGAVIKEDTKRTVAGRRTSVGHRADLGVIMLIPFKLYRR